MGACDVRLHRWESRAAELVRWQDAVLCRASMAFLKVCSYALKVCLGSIPCLGSIGCARCRADAYTIVTRRFVTPLNFLGFTRGLQGTPEKLRVSQSDLCSAPTAS